MNPGVLGCTRLTREENIDEKTLVIQYILAGSWPRFLATRLLNLPGKLKLTPAHDAPPVSFHRKSVVMKGASLYLLLLLPWCHSGLRWTWTYWTPWPLQRPIFTLPSKLQSFFITLTEKWLSSSCTAVWSQYAEFSLHCVCGNALTSNIKDCRTLKSDHNHFRFFSNHISPSVILVHRYPSRF